MALVAAGCGGSPTPIGGVGGSAGASGDPGPAPNHDAGATCSVNGKDYPNGATGIPAPDGCNQCSCASGQLSCTALGCVQPKTCGGLLGTACPAGQYCQYPADARCGAADQTGTCSAIPDACGKSDAPVCGCDGTTYANACSAAVAGTSVAHAGTCEAKPAACTVGGVSYPDGASGIAAPDGCNTCVCTNGKLVCSLLACTESKRCGARAGNTCTANEYCAYTEGGYCGAADAESVCKPRPGACDQKYAPVCGCDGKTYANDCTAALAGSGVLHAGPCSGAGKSCVVGGVTYADGSSKIAAGDGCNTCSCTDGSLLCTRKACTNPKSCGGITGAICAADEYCAYAAGQNCGYADASSTCQKRPQVCPELYAPVCGCDGKTYPSECHAGAAGVGVMGKGACAP